MVSVQLTLVDQSCPTHCNSVNHSTPGLPVHHQLSEFNQTHVHQVGNVIQSSHPLSSPSPLAPNPSQHQSLSNESTLRMRWPKYWSFSFSISPSKEHPGLISFRMDWLDLLAVQGTLKSLLQYHSSKASVLRHSAFFTVQLSHPYMTTGKTIALTRGTFVGKVMSLLFDMLSQLVVTFLPRSKRLLVSWCQLYSPCVGENGAHELCTFMRRGHLRWSAVFSPGDGFLLCTVRSGWEAHEAYHALGSFEMSPKFKIHFFDSYPHIRSFIQRIADVFFNTMMV